MCELLALSALYPATLSISLHEFSLRGGVTGHHVDGWGVAFYEDGDVRLLREPVPASTSPCVRMLKESGLTGQIILSHIRKATQGERVLRNTQPFVRELGGRKHTFAHNGDLSGAHTAPGLPRSRFKPVGETDSEVAFCALLERMVPLWGDDGVPSLGDRLEVVTRFAADVRPMGPANFLYSDGDYIFVHGHKRTQADRGVRPPGLHMLTRACPAGHIPEAGGGLQIEPCPTEQRVALVASVPLTDHEDWVALEEGQIVVLAAGREVLPDRP
jgi:glutamine amidotransferase